MGSRGADPDQNPGLLLRDGCVSLCQATVDSVRKLHDGPGERAEDELDPSFHVGMWQRPLLHERLRKDPGRSLLETCVGQSAWQRLA
eukprot:8832467-Heterocapsa_arctica.AAC.1